MGQWEEFLAELTAIEAQYWQHFRKSGLSDHYILQEDENKSLRFGFKKGSDLPMEIMDACMKIYKKYRSEQRTA